MIRRHTSFFLILLSVLFFTNKSNAQITVTPADTAVCPGDQYTITADFTTQFDIISIDDVFGNLLEIGFPFEFYGETFTQVVISANNFLSFNPAHANGGSSWVYSTAVNNGQLNRAIMFPYQDVHMGIANPGDINFQSFGNAPNRIFVVEFCTTKLFGCTSPTLGQEETNQVVLYENGGIIEMFIKNHTACNAHNSATGVQGLRFDGQQDLVPGRDLANVAWSVQEDGRRFTPNSNGGYTIEEIPYEPLGILADVDVNDVEWYRIGDPTLLGTGPSINVTVQGGDIGYEARLSAVPCMYGTEMEINGFSLIEDAMLRDTVKVVICEGESFEFMDSIFTTNTVYEVIEHSLEESCPTVHRLELTVNQNANAEWLQDYENLDVYFCKGGEVGLILKYPIDGQTYFWYRNDVEIDNPLGNSHIYKVSVPGEYKAVIFNSLGCTDTSATITVREEIVDIDFEVEYLFGCDGDSISVHNLSEQGTYAWTFGVGVQVPDTNRDPFYFYPFQNEYQVKLKMTNELGCTDSLAKMIDTRRIFEVNFTPSADSLCENEYQTITFENHSQGDIESMIWDFGNGTTSTQFNPSILYYQPGTYEVVLTATDIHGCVKTHTHSILIDSLPAMNLNLTKTDICEGEQVVFDLEGQTSSLSVIWDFGDGVIWESEAPVDGRVQHSYPSAGSYNLTLTATPLVCPIQTLLDTVHVYEIPLVKLSEDGTMCLDAEGTLLSNISGKSYMDAEYRWSTGSEENEIVVLTPGSYSLEINNFGCIGVESVEIGKDCYVNIPNAFSPNGDGDNDYFFPRQLLTEGVIGFEMHIFNRWGQKVFETQNAEGRGWDGQFNNQEQPSGVYVYQITVIFKNGRIEQYSGNVTLLR